MISLLNTIFYFILDLKPLSLLLLIVSVLKMVLANIYDLKIFCFEWMLINEFVLPEVL